MKSFDKDFAVRWHLLLKTSKPLTKNKDTHSYMCMQREKNKNEVYSEENSLLGDENIFVTTLQYIYV